MNKSEMMREMFKKGKTVSEVSHELNANYAYCYGVYQRWQTKLGNDYHMMKGETKSNKIVEMFKSGKTVSEIAKELNSNYSYVWSVCNKVR